MAIQILDPAGAKDISVLRPDDASESFRSFLIKNSGAEPVSSLKAQLSESGFGETDADYLLFRSKISMAYTRQSTGLPESKNLAISGIHAESNLPAELETVLLDGWLQLSSDKFTWASSNSIGTLAAGASKLLYARLKWPSLSAYQTFSFTLKNIGSDTFQSVVLTRTGTDLLSPDGSAYDTSVSLGNIGPGISKTVYIRSYAIDPSMVFPGKIDIYSGSPAVLEVRLLFDALGMAGAYASPQSVRDYLRTIDVNVIASDEEILDLVHKASAHLDEKTSRTFGYESVSERYEDPGSGKIILKGWPVLELISIKCYDVNNNLAKTLLPTDTDWAQNVILNAEDGLVEFPFIKRLTFTSVLLPRWETGEPLPVEGQPRYKEERRIRYVAPWIVVDYKYGFQIPPALVRDACKKLVSLELLKKKAASETQGSSSFSMAGFGQTWAQGTGAAAGPFGQMLAMLKEEIAAIIDELKSRKILAPAIL